MTLLSVGIRVSIVLTFFPGIFSTKSLENFNVIYRNKSNSELLLFNCIKDIIRSEGLENILIITRPEHFYRFDIAPFGDATAIKVYARNRGWKNFRLMLSFKRMSFLLTFNRFREIEDYIEHCKKIRLFNSRLRFIIVPLGKLSKIELQHCSEFLIRSRILNYVILMRKPNETAIQIVTNFPYKNKSCGDYSLENDEVIATYDNNASFRYFRENVKSSDFYPPWRKSKLFPSKIPRDLHNCELHIVTGLWPPNVIDINRDIYPGIEIEFVRMIAEHMKFVPKYRYINAIVGERLPNRSWSGFMGYLQRKEVEMAIGAVHVDPQRDFYFDLSYWYLYNYMLWIVPRMRPPPKSAIYVHFIIDSSILAKSLFISVFLSSIIAMLITAKTIRSKRDKLYRRIENVVTILVQMFLSQPTPTTPNSFKIRLLFGSWLGFSTLVIFLFQTSITSFFTTTGKADQITDIQDAFKLNLRISYDEYYDVHVRNASQDFDLTQRNEKHPVIPSLNLVSRGEAVTFIDRLRAIYITKQWLREDGSIPIVLLNKNTVYRYWVQVVMTKGHFLSPWIDELVQKAKNNGFWSFKENQYIDRRTIRCSVRRQLILYNDEQGLDNREAVDRYNDAITEAFPTGAANEEVNKIFQPIASSKEELLDIFRVPSDSSISFQHLIDVFDCYVLGMSLCIVVFICEIVYFRLQRNAQAKKKKVVGKKPKPRATRKYLP